MFVLSGSVMNCVIKQEKIEQPPGFYAVIGVNEVFPDTRRHQVLKPFAYSRSPAGTEIL